MAELPSEKAIETWVRLVRTETEVLDRVNAALRATGLPPLVWYDVLLELQRAGEPGLRQYEVGARTLLPKHNLSRLIDRLEGEGLVQRRPCPEDARGNVVLISAAGRQLVKRMWRVYGGILYQAFESKLTPAEISRLGELLAKLV